MTGAGLRTCPDCGRDDLRGAIGLTMHRKRAHQKNWSTRSKPVAAHA